MSGVSVAGVETERRAPVTGGRRNRRKRDNQGRLAFWLLLPAAIAVFGVIVYPILRTLLISFFEVNSALATDTPFVGLQNYIHTLTSPLTNQSTTPCIYPASGTHR